MRMTIALALFALPLPAAAQTITGTAMALDGDTIEMTGQRLRLFGIDAPELEQTCQRDGTSWDCGAKARRQLALMIEGAEIECTSRAQDAQGAAIAECTLEGRDLSEAMVAAGLAIAIETGPGNAPYSDLEQRVRLGRGGLWAGTFDRPSQWRAAHPRARLSAGGSSKVRSGSAASRAGGSAIGQGAGRSSSMAGTKVYRNSFGCAIKGNVSRRNGEYIYYVPGMKYYDGTRPEQLFCTEAEAQAAGFRRSRGG